MIIRTCHDVNNRYVQVARSTAQDGMISFEARGVLVYLLSKPDKWECSITDLMKAGGIGRHKADAIVKKLIEARYIVREKKRDTDGKFTTIVYKVYEVPQSDSDSDDDLDIGGPNTDEPHTENPNTDKPNTENPHVYINTEYREKTEREETEGKAKTQNGINESSPPRNSSPLPKTVEGPLAEVENLDAVLRLTYGIGDCAGMKIVDTLRTTAIELAGLKATPQSLHAFFSARKKKPALNFIPADFIAWRSDVVASVNGNGPPRYAGCTLCHGRKEILVVENDKAVGWRACEKCV